MKISCKHCGTQFNCVNCYSNGRYAEKKLASKKYPTPTLASVKKKNSYQTVYGSKPSAYTMDPLEADSLTAYKKYKNSYKDIYKKYEEQFNANVMINIGDIYEPQTNKYIKYKTGNEKEYNEIMKFTDE